MIMLGQDNGQPIDEKLYLGGTQIDELLLETTSGRITLEIVGLSDYTEFSQHQSISTKMVS